MSAVSKTGRVRLEDVLPAAAATAVAVVYVWIAVDGDHHDILAALCAVFFVPALVFWRAKPLTSAVAVTLLLALWTANWVWVLPSNSGVTPLLLCAPLAVYSVSRYGKPRRAGAVVLLVMLLGTAVSPLLWRLEDGELVYDPGAALDWLVIQWLVLVMVFFVGRSRRKAAAQARELERARVRIAEDAQVAAREKERGLIAREIHDVLAHSLTLINVQAGAGQVAGHTDGGADAALARIRDVSSSALTEVRSIVRALRETDLSAQAAQVDQTSPPSVGLRQVPALLQRFRDAGLVVDGVWPDGPALDNAEDTVPRITQLAVQRVLAESLGNALRHQGTGTHVTVRLELLVGTNRIEMVVQSRVTQAQGSADGDGNGGGAGLGIVSMRERVTSLGGFFDYSGGSGDTPTVTVSTVLPVDPAQPCGDYGEETPR